MVQCLGFAVCVALNVTRGHGKCGDVTVWCLVGLVYLRGREMPCARVRVCVRVPGACCSLRRCPHSGPLPPWHMLFSWLPYIPRRRF